MNGGEPSSNFNINAAAKKSSVKWKRNTKKGKRHSSNRTNDAYESKGAIQKSYAEAARHSTAEKK